MNYSLHNDYKILQTEQFKKWFKALRDIAAKPIIARRIERFVDGNPGDSKSVGDNIFELRFTFGSGYRVYYTYREQYLIILLMGGNKSNQEADIKQAKKLAKEIKDGKIIEI